MPRRRMTLRRIDPWSVLKFGVVVNLCLLAIALLGAAFLWYAVRQLGLIEQACELAISVGFEECGVDGGNLFRVLLLIGLLGVVVQTALYVFLAFLHNLIADLVGGLSITVFEEGGARPATVAGPARRPASERREERPQRAAARERPVAAAGGSSLAGPSEGRRSDPGREREEEILPPKRAQRPEPVASSERDRTATSERWPWERSVERRSDERLFGRE